MDDKQKDKLRKAAKGTSIAVNVLLFLGGVALAAFLVWLGVEIFEYLGGAI